MLAMSTRCTNLMSQVIRAENLDVAMALVYQSRTSFKLHNRKWGDCPLEQIRASN
jgi:hypothetical protein